MSNPKKFIYYRPEFKEIEIHLVSRILSGSALAGSFAPEEYDTPESSGAGSFMPED